VHSKEFGDAFDQQIQIESREVQYTKRLDQMIHQRYPERKQAKEGIVLQKVYDLDDKLIECETQINYEGYPGVPKPERDRQDLIAEYKQLRQELEAVISTYLDSAK
jgi:hypothetical protein